MNVETGHVISDEAYQQLDPKQRAAYARVSRQLAPAAAAAMAGGYSLFNGRHSRQRVVSRALALARKHKAKQKRKAGAASRKRNRA